MIGLCADKLAGAGLRETATLLSIAHLDLRVRLAGLTENEMAAFAAICTGGGEARKT